MFQQDRQYLHTCFETRCTCHSTSRAKCQQQRKNWAVANSEHVEELSISLDPESHQLPQWMAPFCFYFTFYMLAWLFSGEFPSVIFQSRECWLLLIFLGLNGWKKNNKVD